MGHGFAATRDAGLLPFAHRFAAAGLDVVLFDYRGFGTSGGRLRQDVNHWRHRKDYHAAIAWARARQGIDPARIVVWGSSYSGGHVIAVAARDPMIAAVISQGAAMDGWAALRMLPATPPVPSSKGANTTVAMTLAALRDVGRALTGRRPLLLPVVGEVGSNAVITAPGSMAGYSHIMGPTFRNELCARGVLRIAFNRPVVAAGRVDCPALFIIAEQDNIAPAASVREAARRVGSRAEVEAFDCGHFDIYVGDVFDKSVSRQVEFLVRQLPRTS
jgi:pimeloyl-ACP methyl ester carboxylesterase